MTETQWKTLLDIIAGKQVSPLPVGFIIDSPWLPNWYGVSILDYFTNDEIWFTANNKVHCDFPDVMFLPGFWSEYGMCTEPSAFGARCCFPVDEFPHANKVLFSADDVESLEVPDPKTDGLLPFVLNRLKLAQTKIEDSGHAIRFAIARGPLNIASYLMGSTEFLTMMMMQPEVAHSLLKKITTFLNDWLTLQRETFPTIDGIFLLDDIIGFLGEEQFKTFVLPYFNELFTRDVSVRFLHNDAPCKISAPFLAEMGVNLFNMGFDVPLNELQELTGGKIALMGNIPPRDVLATRDDKRIISSAKELVSCLNDTSRVIFSCGGGMPPGVSSASMKTFLSAIQR